MNKIKSKEYLNKLLLNYPLLTNLRKQINLVINLLKSNYELGGKILVCGNGGSSADAEHIVGELMKGFVLKRPINNILSKKIQNLFPDEHNFFFNNLQNSFPAISLVSQTSLISAYNNDNNPDLIYAQQVLGYGNIHDSLICISTSGNSKNVLNAAKIAKVIDIPVIGLTGNDGGNLKQFSDILINVPANETSRVQELHLPIYHTICLILENEIFG